MPWFLAKDNHIDIHDAQRLAFIARTVRRAASERNVPLHLMFSLPIEFAWVTLAFG